MVRYRIHGVLTTATAYDEYYSQPTEPHRNFEEAMGEPISPWRYYSSTVHVRYEASFARIPSQLLKYSPHGWLGWNTELNSPKAATGCYYSLVFSENWSMRYIFAIRASQA